jgi:periplasmic divalent cation tolerance protein
MSPGEEILVLCSVNDEDLAQEFISDMLEDHLVLSGSILPGQVMYIFNGQLTIEGDFKLLLKAREGNYTEIEQYIMKKHPYRSPEIVKIPASFGSDEFRRFLMERKTMAE